MNIALDEGTPSTMTYTSAAGPKPGGMVKVTVSVEPAITAVVAGTV